MNCMKCGREIGENQVFCDHCLEIMAKYPVKPGIAVQLPSKKSTPVLKKVHPRRRQAVPPEEQVKVLKKRLRRMVMIWLLTLVLLAATLYPTVEYFLGKTFPQPGQNYSTITATESTAP